MNFLPVQTFQLVLDVARAELQVLPANAQSRREKSETVCFRLKRRSESNERKGSGEIGEQSERIIHLFVHVTLLEDKGHALTEMHYQNVIDLHDGPVEELSFGLLSLGTTSQLSAHLAQYATAMLCDRLRDVLRQLSSTESKRFQAWQVTAIDAVFSRDLDEVTTLEEIATQCRISICHFSRLFKATYGSPFHNYLLHRRIDHAKKQLVHSDTPLSAIALDCGFSDQSCFTRRFTMITGLSPGMWRKTSRRELSVEALPMPMAHEAAS